MNDKITIPPKVLIITLKRYLTIGTGDNVSVQKITNAVQASNIIEFGTNYQIKNFVIHDGQTPFGGHYWAILRMPDGTYKKCNDTNITKIPSQEAWNNRDNNQCYLLFY